MSRFWVSALCFVLVLGSVWAGSYSGGEGTAESPYRIGSAADWMELIAAAEDLDGHFELTADIDFEGAEITPVGGSTGHFTGVLDGRGHVIRHFVINRPDGNYVGLFGIIGSRGKIIDLGAEGFSVTGREYVGGMCGQSYGLITQSYAKGSVSGLNVVGGLCGTSYLGKISRCYSMGEVSGRGYIVGGLLGGAGDVEDCYSAAVVIGEEASEWIGGLIGWGWGAVNRCVWDVETSGQTGSRGGKGATTEQMKSMELYRDAGWAGKGWVIKDGADYPRLAWDSTEGAAIEEPGVLPLAGSGTEGDPYRIYTGEEFASLSRYWLALGSHFVLMNDADLAAVELQPIGDLGAFNGVFDGDGYVLRNAKIHQGGNTDVGLWAKIGVEGEVRNVRAQDIDVRGGMYVGGLAGSSDGTIANCHFTGTVHGVEMVGGLCGFNRGVISDCHAGGDVAGTASVGGLCGYNADGTIEQSHATGCVIGEQTAGGLCGANVFGSILACRATGPVTGGNYAGGLVGDNGCGFVGQCYATGDVKGVSYVGGLCGFNDGGTISDCRAMGAVSGTNNVGGLCGYSDATISHSFAAGKVTGVGIEPEHIGGLIGRGVPCETRGCFWDVEASGMDLSAGGVGKTTAEMKARGTFAAAGWDFVGEWTNGTADVWRMCVDGVGYPRLSREYSRGGDFDCPDGVGLEDLRYLAERWLAEGEGVGAADGNGDGRADAGDFLLMAERWREGDDMVFIPAGTFEMGDSFSEGSWWERPVHTVTLSLFYMSKYETTNSQYRQFLNSALQQGLITVNNGIVYKAGSGTSFPYCDTSTANSWSHISFSNDTFTVLAKGGRNMTNDPMVMVSWYGAVAYCNWRSEQEGLQPCYDLSTWECDFSNNGYRIPTEAQWEYAARGGLSGSRFPWGDTISHSQANYHSGYRVYETGPTTGSHPTWYDGIRPYTSPVGSFAPNGYGLYDVTGNVWEWCNDRYSSTYYGSSPQTDPTGPTFGSYRVIRGGSWLCGGFNCRVAARYDLGTPNCRSANYGFRVCR